MAPLALQQLLVEVERHRLACLVLAALLATAAVEVALEEAMRAQVHHDMTEMLGLLAEAAEAVELRGELWWGQRPLPPTVEAVEA